MTEQDFLTNQKFVKWVNHPDRESDAYWKAWMAAHPEHLPSLKLARELLMRIRYKDIEPRAGAKQRILHNILQSTQATKPASVEAIVPKENRVKPRVAIWDKIDQFQRIAAILLVSFSLAWLAIPPKGSKTSELMAELIPNIERTTSAGEKLQITVPDGTRVWLNSVSTLEFPERFDSLERWVRLSGEGFFDVGKDSLRPFNVITDGMITTALGTSFNINDKSSEGIKVSLLTGKVKIKATESSEDVFLDPGQELKYDKDLERISISSFNSEDVVAWKEGKIVFKDAKLVEVVDILEDWYGITINVKNGESVDWKYSGEYSNQSLENVLNSMAYIQKFKYTIHEKNVEFKF